MDNKEATVGSNMEKNCNNCKFRNSLTIYEYEFKRWGHPNWKFYMDGVACTVHAVEGVVIHYKGIKPNEFSCEYFKERE